MLPLPERFRVTRELIAYHKEATAVQRETNKLLQELIKLQSSRQILTISVVEIVTPGRPTRGPDIVLPNGTELVVRLRPDNTATITGYVSITPGMVTNSLRRSELQEGDSLTFRIRNPHMLFFDADTAGAKFEVIAEIVEI